MDSDARHQTDGAWIRQVASESRDGDAPRLAVCVGRVAAACRRYDDLVDLWEGRDPPSFEVLSEVLEDPRVQPQKLELAIVGLSRVERVRARAALRWFERPVGQPHRVADLAKVALFEWRLRFATEDPLVERPAAA